MAVYRTPVIGFQKRSLDSAWYELYTVFGRIYGCFNWAKPLNHQIPSTWKRCQLSPSRYYLKDIDLSSQMGLPRHGTDINLAVN